MSIAFYRVEQNSLFRSATIVIALNVYTRQCIERRNFDK
jgi:hypothetical protein